MPKWHSAKEWEEHIDVVSQLWIRDRKSDEYIAEYLTNLPNNNFPTTGRKIKDKRQEWRIQRYSDEEEMSMLAKCLLHQRTQGQAVKFFKWGETIPIDQIERYIAQHPTIEASSEPLPAYLKMEIVASTFPTDIEMTRPTTDEPSFSGLMQPVNESATNEQLPNVGSRKRPRVAFQLSPTDRSRRSASTQRQTTSRENNGTNQTRGRQNNEEDEASKVEEAKIEKALKTLTKYLGTKGEKHSKALKQLEELVTEDAPDEEEEKRESPERTDAGPLHYAASTNNVRIVEALILKGADINARGGYNWTALHVAAVKGNFEVLNFLLQQDGVDIDAVDDDGATALLFASATSSLDCALMLIKHGANVDKGVHKSQNALLMACLEDDLDQLVEALAEKTADVNAQDRHGRTALHYAVNSPNEAYVTTLLKYGADPNIPDEDGRTVMHQACFNGSKALLFQIIESNVDLTAKGKDDETALHLICVRDLCDVAKAIIGKAGVDVNAKTRRGTTPLILAAAFGHYDTVRMLVLEGRADLTVMDSDLDTALSVAIQKNREEIALFLIEQQSPVNPSNISEKKWKANRKAQIVGLSAPITAVPASQASRQQQASTTRSHSSRMSRSALHRQAMQHILPELIDHASQRVDAALAHGHYPMSPKANMGGNNFNSLAQYAFGNSSITEYPFDFNSAVAMNQNNPINDNLPEPDVNVFTGWIGDGTSQLDQLFYL